MMRDSAGAERSGRMIKRWTRMPMRIPSPTASIHAMAVGVPEPRAL